MTDSSQRPQEIASTTPSISTAKGELATLIIVDDEQGILDTYAHYLNPDKEEGVIQSARRTSPGIRAEGSPKYRLLLATTGERAVELVQEEVDRGGRVQAGFFDMKMPGGIDGLETISRIRAIDPDIYCIIVTAYEDRSLEEIAKVSGMQSFDSWDYLNKPFTANEIVQKARNATVSWKNCRQNEARIRSMDETNRALQEAVTKRNEGLAIASHELREKRTKLEKAIKEIAAQNRRLKNEITE